MKKTETKSTVLLKHHLKALRLPTMTAECEKVAARCAKENVDHLGFLLQLCELELLERERRAAQRRLKAARFPTVKTLEAFDFASRKVADAYKADAALATEHARIEGANTARFLVARLGDAVRLVLEHSRERPVGLFCLDGRPHLKMVGVPAPDLTPYASLTAGVAP